MADQQPSLSRAVGRAFFGRFAELRGIQVDAIPAVLSGSDTLIRSATASGKTEAAIAPLAPTTSESAEAATSARLELTFLIGLLPPGVFRA